MATSFDTYLPFSSGAGGNVTENQWEDFAEQWMPNGVVFGYTNGLAVAAHAPANLSVDVATGQCRIRGHEGILTTGVTLVVGANANANPRIDLVVARVDLTAKTVALDIVAGTPAAAPVEPALTQNSSVWEIALAALYVGPSTSTITDVRDRRTFTRTTRMSTWKEPVRAATTTAMAASTATATTRVANANGVMAAVDGVTPVAGDRLLDKDHATGAARGIWQVVDVGSASTPWRLERPADADSYPVLRSGVTVKVSEGTTNVGTEWVLTTANPITVGTTSQTWTAAGGGSGDSDQIILGVQVFS
jgi:hypothetical protein